MYSNSDGLIASGYYLRPVWLSLIDYSSRRHLQAGEPRGDLGDLAATWAALGGALVRVRARLGLSLTLMLTLALTNPN